MDRFYDIKKIIITDETLDIVIDGVSHSFNLREVSPLLSKANNKERETYEISPSGYGIHWPLLDEDLSIDGLLGIVHTSDYTRMHA